MDSENTNELERKIENEIDFARAVTALMMAAKLDAADTSTNRAELRLNSNFRMFQSDIEKRAS